MKKFLSLLLCLLLATNAFSADFSAMKLKDTTNTIINPATSDKQGNLSTSGNTIISTHNDKFRDDFNTFDEVNNWTVKQLGTGQSYELRGVAGGARFLAINSGTTSGAETILLCKKSFKVPFKVTFGVSVTLSSDTSGAATSGRQANLLPILEVVEVDDNGDVVETADAQTYSGLVPNVMGIVYDGTTVTTNRLVMRASANSESAVATAMGNYASTTPSGSYPNYIQAGNQVIIATNEYGYYTSERPDLTTVGTLYKKNTSVIDPTKNYTIRIRLKNNAAVTAADFNIHMIRVCDASRVSVDFGLVNPVDAQAAAPVYVQNMVSVVYPYVATSYGSSFHHYQICGNSTNDTLVDGTVSVITNIVLSNSGNDDVYFKLYNKATAPTVGTDTPVLVIMIPAGQTVSVPAGVTPIRFPLGIGYGVTKGIADNDTTAIDASKVIVTMTYVS